MRDIEKQREYNKAYYQKNKAAINANNKKYRDSNKESLAEYLSAWYDRLPYEKKIFNAARARATKRGIPFTISIEDIVIPELCPILGIPIEYNKGKHAGNSASLDRINPSKGYQKDNIAVISNRANRIKNDGTADEHQAIADWLRQCS